MDAGVALVKLRYAAGMKSRADREIAKDVQAARRAGATWDEIGRVLGVRRQAAQRKYGSERQAVSAG